MNFVCDIGQQDGKFVGKTVLIDEYDVTYDPKGRKDNLIVIGIELKSYFTKKKAA